jgi:acetylornithine deacetylase/succinyl-diaminopimelate desuccinylase-like protein
MPNWERHLEVNHDRYLNDLIELLRIQSVSAATVHTPDVHRAAEWVAGRLGRAGLQNIHISPTGDHHCVYAEWLHAPGKPTVLFYGHFDVQPPDPLDQWDTPPFDPSIRDGRIYARGACDMKANLLMIVEAVEATLAAEGALPVNVKFLVEGQEEIGSRDLPEYVSANRERLACDIVLTSDGGQWSETQPLLCLGTKGLCAVQIDVRGAGFDLHSGIYGGAVPNANHLLVEILNSMRDSDGKITVEGFYDHVAPLTPEERREISDVPFDEEAYKQDIGITALVGEPGYTTYERAWARPTLEINGVWGGYQGDGVKTVIPAEAHAKITCRLVANQEPHEIVACIKRHVESHTPKGAEVTVTRLAGQARPYYMPADHPANRATARILTGLYGVPPLMTRSGGTLPIMDLFLRELNAYTVVAGFALDDERAHSPNEFIRIADIVRGRRCYCLLLEEMAASL